MLKVRMYLSALERHTREFEKYTLIPDSSNCPLAEHGRGRYLPVWKVKES